MIYLDNAATTKPSKNAIEFASKYNEDCFFNPSALYHGGVENKNAINAAKETLINAFATPMHEVIFTSCGSESDNQAVFSSAKKGIAVTSQGEHAAIYSSFSELKSRGVPVEFIPLKSNGEIDEEKLYAVCEKGGVSFVSVVHVNNETGAINDINKIAANIKKIDKNIIFHSDGVQAFGKIPYRLSGDIDLYSISAHKIGAIKGTGALIKKKNLTLKPLIYGGGQENGLRSGTENIFGIKVFEYQIKEKYAKINDSFNYAQNLKKAFLDRLNKDNFTVISDDTCSPYIISLSVNKVKGEVITHMAEADGIVIGNGSACSSRAKYSRVIEACGYKNNEGIVRISFSANEKIEDIIFAAEKINGYAEKLRKVMGR